MRKFILQQDCNWLSKFFWQNMKYHIHGFFLFITLWRDIRRTTFKWPEYLPVKLQNSFSIMFKKDIFVMKKKEHCSLHSTFVQLKCSMHQVSNTAGHQDQGVHKITIWSLQNQRFYCFDNIHCLSLEKEAKKSIGIRSLA